MVLDLTDETADYHKAVYGVSKRDFLAWKAHRDSAKCRGIEFRFSLLAWSLWWSHELRLLGPDARRGRNRANYVMARVRDRGAYEYDNVRCLLVKPATTSRKPRGYHLKVRGDGHPKSRAVITPEGRFGSMALAAEAFGLTRAGVLYRVKRGADGWAYA